jgi:hypothetical protein
VDEGKEGGLSFTKGTRPADPLRKNGARKGK